MDVLSPITGQHPTTIELTLQSINIIALYRELGLDVERFFRHTKEVELRKCSATGYRFYFPYTIFGDDAFYAELQTKLAGYYSESRWEHLLSQKLMSEGQKVLEVGCGSGYFLQMLKSKNVEAEGLELNKTAYADAAEKGLAVYNHLLNDHAVNHQNYYDIVCSFQVLEHITDVRSYIEDCIKVLKPGGKIIIGVPNNNPYIFKHDKYHTLNLPPHHAGLWNRTAFENIDRFFPITLNEIYIEPLREYKEWFEVQKRNQRENNQLSVHLLNLVPRPVYKAILKLFRNKIEGRNIIAVFSKK